MREGICVGVSLTRVRGGGFDVEWSDGMGMEGAACVVTGIQTVISFQSAQRRRDLATNFCSDERSLPLL